MSYSGRDFYNQLKLIHIKLLLLKNNKQHIDSLINYHKHDLTNKLLSVDDFNLISSFGYYKLYSIIEYENNYVKLKLQCNIQKRLFDYDINKIHRSSIDINFWLLGTMYDDIPLSIFDIIDKHSFIKNIQNNTNYVLGGVFNQHIT